MASKIELGTRAVNTYDGSHGTVVRMDPLNPYSVLVLRDDAPGDTGVHWWPVEHLEVEDAAAADRRRRERLQRIDDYRTDYNGAPCWCAYHTKGGHTQHCQIMRRLADKLVGERERAAQEAA